MKTKPRIENPNACGFDRPSSWLVGTPTLLRSRGPARLGSTIRRFGYSVVLAAAVFAVPLQAQIVFDATADFSITNGNPNGAWSYGWMPTDFSLFQLVTNATANNNGNSPGWGSVTGFWKNLGGEAYGVPTGWLSLHPGSGEEPCVLRWTSPVPGLARVQGRFLAGDQGFMRVAVRMRGIALWQANDSGEFDLLESITAGDTVDFVVYGGYCCGNTPLEAIITFTPMGSGILLRPNSPTVQETERTVVLEVLRFDTEHLDEVVTVDYATVDDTAHAGEDYVATSGTLRFAAGETNKQIAIAILDDALAEGEEQFRLVLSNPTGGVSLGFSNVVIRIQSDELVTYYVNVNNPNPVFPYTSWETAATNIQHAVDATKAGDTVLVTNGVYAVGSRSRGEEWTLNRVVVTNAIRLESVNGPLVTMIDGGCNSEYWSPTAVRCVYLSSNAVLSGFTLTNGYARLKGGGVFSEPNGSVTNCVLIGNRAGQAEEMGGLGAGGGVYGGMLYNCTLANNNCGVGGGGVAHSTLYNCTLTDNHTEGKGSSGGGAYNSTLYNCTLTSNVATYLGSGGGASGSTLYNCTLSGNWVWGVGGGAFDSTLYNCTLSGNTADYLGSGSGCTLYNCIVTDNEGGSDGQFFNCTVVGNNGGVSGIVFNSIIYYNSGGNYAEGTILNFSCTTPIPTNGIGNIVGPPLFMDMAAGDFRLREESPCIDAGTNLVGFTMMATNTDNGEIYVAASYTYEPTDILGNTRFIDGNFDGKVAWDIGAYEFNSFIPPRFTSPPQLTSDGWKLNITGAANKMVRLQRSSNLKDWEDALWPPDVFMGTEGVKQVTDSDTGQKAMFYRAVVP